jgi:hypothetical protein
MGISCYGPNMGMHNRYQEAIVVQFAVDAKPLELEVARVLVVRPHPPANPRQRSRTPRHVCVNWSYKQ